MLLKDDHGNDWTVEHIQFISYSKVGLQRTGQGITSGQIRKNDGSMLQFPNSKPSNGRKKMLQPTHPAWTVHPVPRFEDFYSLIAKASYPLRGQPARRKTYGPFRDRQ